MLPMNLGEELGQLWRTRPVRVRGPIAGVAAGFGERYGLRAHTVRAAFVVGTIFGGAGLGLYLLAWLVLRTPHAEVCPAAGLAGKGESHQPTGVTVMLVVAMVAAFATMGPLGVALGGSGLLALAALIAGWWILYLRQPTPPAGDVSPNTVGSWDPLGVSPLDWELPETPSESRATPTRWSREAYSSHPQRPDSPREPHW